MVFVVRILEGLEGLCISRKTRNLYPNVLIMTCRNIEKKACRIWIIKQNWSRHWRKSMKVLVDTNVILDDLMGRSDYFHNADRIITRNVKDFSSSSVPAVTPDEFLKQWGICWEKREISTVPHKFWSVTASWSWRKWKQPENPAAHFRLTINQKCFLPPSRELHRKLHPIQTHIPVNERRTFLYKFCAHHHIFYILVPKKHLYFPARPF